MLPPTHQGDRASSLLVCHHRRLLRLPKAEQSDEFGLRTPAQISLGGKKKEKRKKRPSCNAMQQMHVHCNDFGGSTHSLRSPAALILYPLGLGLACNVSAPPEQRGQKINKRGRDAWEMKGTRMHATDATSYRASHDRRSSDLGLAPTKDRSFLMRLARPSSLARSGHCGQAPTLHTQTVKFQRSGTASSRIQLELPLASASAETSQSRKQHGPVDRQASEDQEKRSTALPPGHF